MKKTSFYRKSKCWEDVIRDIKYAKRERLEKQQKEVAVYKSRILGPAQTWKVFYTQSEAFQTCQTAKKDLHVFSFESECFQESSGQRMFLVTTYEEFWHYYSQLLPKQRHHYEVIAEGAVCHLYFDLEYMKEFNTKCDGVKMCNILIQYVSCFLKLYWGIESSASDIIQLESSTDKKFSRHLIFRLKKIVFKNNIVMGYFVKHIMSILLYIVNSKDEELNKSCKVENLQQTDINSSQHSSNITLDFQDLDMNTSGTDLFSTSSNSERLFEDSSFQDTLNESELLEDKISTGNKSVIEPDLNESQERSEEFLHAANLSKEDLQLLIIKDKDGKKSLFCDLGVYTKNRNFRLYLSSKLKKNSPLVLAGNNSYEPKVQNQQKYIKRGRLPPDKSEQLFLDSLITNIKYRPDIKVLTFTETTASKYNKSFPKRVANADCANGSEASPYPDVDDFVRSIITRGGVQGDIWRWLYFSESATICYDISKNRWCERINRQHKSNKILIVVHLKLGIYNQKCHDPECKLLQFKSRDYPLPVHLLKKYVETHSKENAESQPSDSSDDTLSDEQLLSLCNSTELQCSSAENTNLNIEDNDTSLSHTRCSELLGSNRQKENQSVPSKCELVTESTGAESNSTDNKQFSNNTIDRYKCDENTFSKDLFFKNVIETPACVRTASKAVRKESLDSELNLSNISSSDYETCHCNLDLKKHSCRQTGQCDVKSKVCSLEDQCQIATYLENCDELLSDDTLLELVTSYEMQT